MSMPLLSTKLSAKPPRADFVPRPHLVETLTLGTVKTHVHNIYRKLGVRKRMEAVMQAQRLKLV